MQHALAKVRDPDAVRAIVGGVAASTLLIADGHHRYETALRYSQEVAAARTGCARPGRAPLLHDVPRQRRRPEPRRLPHAPSRALAPVVLVRRLARGALPLFRGRGARPRTGADAACSRRFARRGRAGPSIAAAAPDGRVSLLTLRRRRGPRRSPDPWRPSPRSLRRTDVAVLHSGLLEHVLGITPEAQAAKTNLWYPQDAASRAGRAARRARAGCSS